MPILNRPESKPALFDKHLCKRESLDFSVRNALRITSDVEEVLQTKQMCHYVILFGGLARQAHYLHSLLMTKKGRCRVTIVAIWAKTVSGVVCLMKMTSFELLWLGQLLPCSSAAAAERMSARWRRRVS